MLCNWSPFIYFSIFLLAFVAINEADGLICKFCQSTNSYNSCISSAGLVECNVALVNVTHLLLNPHNPSLGKMLPANQYQCFQVNYTTNGVLNYNMGCTFAGSKICEGWKVLSQCKVSNSTEGQIGADKMSSKSTPQLPSAIVTPKGIAKSFGGKVSTQAAKHSGSGVSTTTVSIAVQSNSSSIGSSLSPNIVNDSNKRKTPSKASVLSLQLEVLLIFWIVVLFWRHS